jgi:hypothetical protein
LGTSPPSYPRGPGRRDGKPGLPRCRGIASPAGLRHLVMESESTNKQIVKQYVEEMVADGESVAVRYTERGTFRAPFGATRRPGRATN